MLDRFVSTEQKMSSQVPGCYMPILGKIKPTNNTTLSFQAPAVRSVDIVSLVLYKYQELVIHLDHHKLHLLHREMSQILHQKYY